MRLIETNGAIAQVAAPKEGGSTMAGYQGTFERKEVKYRLSAVQYRAILAAFEGRLAPDVYGSSLVKSVYFDTENRDMIAKSIEKPLYKEKLRVRSYGTPAEGDLVYVEIKKKFKGVVYKRRVGMTYAAARAYLGGMPYEQACIAYPQVTIEGREEELSKTSVQVSHEIDALKERWGMLCASVMTSCVRTAYGPIDENGVGCSAEDGLRVTFDSSLAFCDMHRSKSASRCVPLIDPEEVIMEIKVRGPLPLWLTKVLDDIDAYPSSFSKYGEAYRRCMAGEPASVSIPVSVPAAYAARNSEVRCA